MKILIKKQCVWLSLIALSVQFWGTQVVSAGGASDVVINEIAWAGTAESSNDEWIELYNAGDEVVDLSGWSIEDDGSTVYEIVEGEIGAYAYFLIEDSEETVANMKASSFAGLSLANSGDELVLKDEMGHVIDEVSNNEEGWYAGDADLKASMERVDPAEDGDEEENWQSAENGNGAEGRDGESILGTPGSVNSVFAGEGLEVLVSPAVAEADEGDVLKFAVEVEEAESVMGYGFNFIYDSSALEFIGGEEGDFLGSGGANTTFNLALENDEQGRLIVANALLNADDGVDGDGVLLELEFEVLADEGVFDLVFGAGSFVNNGEHDLPVVVTKGRVLVGEVEEIVDDDDGGLIQDGNVAPAKDVKAKVAEQRFAIELAWKAAAGAESYIVMREKFDGSFEIVGSTPELKLVDDIAILPGVEFKYRIVAVQGGLQSPSEEILASDNRGVLGDISRDDRVDGRDILKLAMSFGAEAGEEKYDVLADLNRDGLIDGSDLIDIGANFAKTYEE
jgi:hypothetical protein